MTRPVLLVAAMLAFAGSYANAQTCGRISGRVVDQTGGPLPAVSIELVAHSKEVYFYVSRLRGEPSEGVVDVHTHPVSPRTIRLGLQMGF
jgi:hypothetical protein